MKITAFKRLHITIITLVLGSCSFGASYQAQLTSLNVGCNADKVKVSNSRYFVSEEEHWTAECDGKIYDCVYYPDGDQSNCFLREE